MSRPIPPHVATAGVEALKTGWLTMGPRTQELETAMAERFGHEHVIATSSGTAALHLTLLAAGASHGASVLVPDLGPASCAGAVEATGAVPHEYAVEGFDPPQRPDGLATAVVVRHHLGFVADLAGFDAAGATLIEDRREALGADHGEAGLVGSAAILSFSSRRPISCGEGGAVVTDDDAIAETVRSLRSHAMTSGSWDRHRGHAETYDVVGVGFNYRIDEVRAAMAEAALADLIDSVARRRERAAEIAEAARSLGAEAPSDERIATAAPVAVPLLAASPDARAELAEELSGRGFESEAPGGDADEAIAPRLLLVGVDAGD